ncbi:uncharacterized protein LOC127022874 isoform X3 [Gymnogyps californianus]|uniref:uncharacterized protein LOC127022874 isoform X3 n=1 Tax=Gymnogyps californianus TaxID=33616 RepID=UPI0021C68780|nr:uncharacterized protein LOC127022874 isoform X3 [Gymnogyps californianus]
MICSNQFSVTILLHKVPFSLEVITLSCQLASGERKKHCHRRMVVPPPSLFDQVTPRILKTRQRSKAQKTLPWVKQKTYFARPLSALIKSAADTGQDSPAWLIAEDLALLKALTEEQTALQLQEQQPSQKQEEEQTVEQIQTRCQPQGETQASGGTLSPVIAVLQQVSVVPAIPAQLEPPPPASLLKQKHLPASVVTITLMTTAQMLLMTPLISDLVTRSSRNQVLILRPQ